MSSDGTVVLIAHPGIGELVGIVLDTERNVSEDTLNPRTVILGTGARILRLHHPMRMHSEPVQQEGGTVAYNYQPTPTVLTTGYIDMPNPSNFGGWTPAPPMIKSKYLEIINENINR